MKNHRIKLINLFLAVVIAVNIVAMLKPAAKTNDPEKDILRMYFAARGITAARVERDSSVISLQESVVDLDEGKTAQLHASTTVQGATIIWISFNSTAVSVSGTGVVTAIKADVAGASILACVLDNNNNLFFDGCLVYAKIPDGTYYLTNKSSGLCADATEYWSGSEVLQWKLHGGLNQRWTIEYISKGEYSITNGMSGLYLGVESLNNTSAKATQYTVLNDKTKWKISKTASGAYCLYAKGNLTYGLAIGSAQSGSTWGTAITNMTYSNDSNYQDEWILDRIKLNYINYYDSSFNSSPGLVSKILEANTFAGEAYNREFDLVIGTISMSRKYDVLCAQCTTGTHVECNDNICGTSCRDNHHKNIHRISDQLYTSLPQNTIACLWTNRGDGTYCFEDEEGEHTLFEYDPYACVYDHRPVIHFFKIEDQDADLSKWCMGLNLIHETAHTFGMDDAYMAPGHPLFSYQCVMQGFNSAKADILYDKIENGEHAFCVNCRNTLSSLIDVFLDN